MQPVASRRAGDGDWCEECAFKKDVLAVGLHARILTTHDTSHGHWPAGIGDHQRVGIQFDLLSIKQHEPVIRLCHTHSNLSIQAIKVKGMHGLA